MGYYKEALFCCLDDFCKLYEEWEKHHLIPKTGQRNRPGKMIFSELLFIIIFYHTSHFRCFKIFYLYGIFRHHRFLFRDVVSYGRYVSLMPRLFLPLCLAFASPAGRKNRDLYCRISSISTHLPVCHNRRIGRNKVFSGLSARGKSTMGWFYGFKLHIVINQKGEIIAVQITAGSTDDRAVLEKMTENLKGKIFADKG